METQRLETISQPPHSCPLVPPHLLWLSSLLPSSFFPLSPPFTPPHFPPASPPCAPSHRCHHHHHLSLRQLMCPVAPCTAPSLHSTGDSGKGAEGRREAHRDKPTGSQAAPEERHSDRGKSPCPRFLPRSETCHPTTNDAGEVGGRSGKIPFPVPQECLSLQC